MSRLPSVVWRCCVDDSLRSRLSVGRDAWLARDDEREVYELAIRLFDETIAIERRVLVSADIRLPDLHVVIQAAMGWSSYHSHAATMSSSAPARLSDSLPARPINLASTSGPRWEPAILRSAVIHPASEMRSSSPQAACSDEIPTSVATCTAPEPSVAGSGHVPVGRCGLLT